tara:strand:+ start:972 stop:2486 length:1515 start_codon:yes stop_codon:yes gene_type:complete
MGGAKSKNIATSTAEAISKVSTDIINNTSSKAYNAQIIENRNIKGDVNISGVTQTQKVTINMQALLDALSTSESQQKLSAELEQTAKSIVSGLNLLQFSDADNSIDNYLKAMNTMSTSVLQTCSADVKNFQVISNVDVDGNINMNNIQQKQVTNVFSNCIEKAVSKSSAIQDLQTKLKQSATAKSEGLNIWAIVIIGLVVLACVALYYFGAAPAAAGQAVKQAITITKAIFFPLLIVSGIVLILVYILVKSSVMSSNLFSGLISNTDTCTAIPLGKKTTAYTTSVQAQEACRKMKDAVAYDWKGMVVQGDGVTKVLDKPTTTFYSSVSDSCAKNLKKSKVKLFKPVDNVAVSAAKPKDASNGDIWIIPTTSEWYQYDSEKLIWEAQSNPLIKNGKMKGGETIAWQEEPPTLQSGKVDSGDYLVTWGDLKSYFVVYNWQKDKYVKQDVLLVPGRVPYTPALEGKPRINASGFKKQVRNPTFLIIGSILSGTGLIGAIVQALISKK